MSKPGRRIYVGYKEVEPVMEGVGMSILTTAKGILSDRNAQKDKVGGELICQVW
ncbi:Ribosomal protein S8 [Candidatus Magnetoovum chiemensis]|nr:Ribosomal protein S8 [Candidatus Magnetoovum chiemensis]